MEKAEFQEMFADGFPFGVIADRLEEEGVYPALCEEFHDREMQEGGKEAYERSYEWFQEAAREEKEFWELGDGWDRKWNILFGHPDRKSYYLDEETGERLDS